ncbi:nicotinate-nucleotide--dimethylbenzimidazole phosphoribosyltransferase [Palleronia pelagia]|uniref:Nicotinate-nucleotide--dimethylbenzimidazole phosphoribosyltransferase n=1 Tax=Palleronia pelagia TaxID=387096 RepID=A0A1H8KUH5_9RHOB|nr:nicotinate-nucleotide--dimethylbenzimidazole phosphoribosyltransferase [Palleronia pelagia]SEN96543.1 nicotinate-nucleotide-dimethylbenzimidazole phosphoribosyltransferase [Palleronia pelagia]
MDAITSIDDFRAALAGLPQPDATALDGAAARNATLTKPAGALGRLEDLAIWYAGWRADPRPKMVSPQILIFAANHGVAQRGVSAFPPEVTAQMVENFRAGGAAINQMAATAGAGMAVHALDLDRPTADFTESPAMEDDDFVAALATGWSALDPQCDLLVVGEMGIGNTTAAAALSAALFGGTGADWTGVGTGVAGAALEAKIATVDAGLARHADRAGDPVALLQALGGRELAAMAAAILRARHLRIPVILDGFICCAAAAPLAVAAPGALDHAVAGHLSAEGAHAALLDRLGKAPILSLGLRLGEGSGAALAIGVLQGALACHSGMASFAEAGVSDG